MQNARSRVLRSNVALHESFGCHLELPHALNYKVNPFAYKKNRKNCECWPGHYLIVNHYSPMP